MTKSSGLVAGPLGLGSARIGLLPETPGTNSVLVRPKPDGFGLFPETVCSNPDGFGLIPVNSSLEAG